MFKKLSSSGTTDAFYGNKYNFLQTQARGIMCHGDVQRSKCCQTYCCSEKGFCEECDLSRVGILPILTDTSFSSKATLELINHNVQVAWLSGCVLLIPSNAGVHSAEQSTRMVKLNKISQIADHIWTSQNKLHKWLRGSPMPSIAHTLYGVYPARVFVTKGPVLKQESVQRS